MFRKALFQPFIFATNRICVLALIQAIPQDFAKTAARFHDRGAGTVNIPIALVAQNKPIVAVVYDETIRDRFDAGPHLHEVCDVYRQADDIPVLRAAVHDLDVISRLHANCHIRKPVLLPSGKVAVQPSVRVFTLCI